MEGRRRNMPCADVGVVLMLVLLVLLPDVHVVKKLSDVREV